jgi:hypothetical protein
VTRGRFQQAATDGSVKRDAVLAEWVRDARQRALEVVADLSDEQLTDPQLRSEKSLIVGGFDSSGPSGWSFSSS